MYQYNVFEEEKKILIEQEDICKKYYNYNQMNNSKKMQVILLATNLNYIKDIKKDVNNLSIGQLWIDMNKLSYFHNIQLLKKYDDSGNELEICNNYVPYFVLKNNTKPIYKSLVNIENDSIVVIETPITDFDETFNKYIVETKYYILNKTSEEISLYEIYPYLLNDENSIIFKNIIMNTIQKFFVKKKEYII